MNDLSSYIKEHPLSQVCTIGIGGPAKYFIEVHTVAEMSQALKACKEQNIPYFILGKGSNTLFDDRGFQGAVIHNKIDFLDEPSAGLFHVGGGYSFSRLGALTARKGWAGLEFASGIPGSVGGAVFMNAGANGQETCDSLLSVDFLYENGDFVTYKKADLSFDYRTSSFQDPKKSFFGAITGATFQLASNEGAREKQLKIINYRTETQPYGDKSAGCMFRNPPSLSAGAIIEKCGLKGLSIGGASVSEIHANFLINQKNATSQEVLQLVEMIKTQVKLETGIELESEVRFVPWSNQDREVFND